MGEIPEPVLHQVLTYLDRNDRYASSLTCRQWNGCFRSASLWRNFTFKFSSEANENQLNFMEDYGSNLRSVRILVNPRIPKNCENLCRILTSLARCQERKLERLSIVFTQETPLFFKGQDILSSLAELFGPIDPNQMMSSTLKEVDLGGLHISYSSLLFELLASNHSDLEVFNIQNNSLTCEVKPSGLVNLVQKCKKLKKLSCFYSSASDDLVDAFLEGDRVPLDILSFACIRDEKFHKPITIDGWAKLTKKYPHLRVSLHFDHTIERNNILNILHPPIPLVELTMRTMSELNNEVSLVNSFYNETLEKLVIATHGTDELQAALLALISNSPNLCSLHCLCGLSEETIQKIKTLKPNLKSYTLMTQEEFDAGMPTVLIGRAARTTAMDVGT